VRYEKTLQTCEVKAREALDSGPDRRRHDVATMSDTSSNQPLSDLCRPSFYHPLQLLAYHIAVRRGCDVDQPRNLAKSVTGNSNQGPDHPPPVCYEEIVVPKRAVRCCLQDLSAIERPIEFYPKDTCQSLSEMSKIS